MDNKDKNSEQKPGFIGGFGFIIVVILGVSGLLLAIKLIIG